MASTAGTIEHGYQHIEVRTLVGAFGAEINGVDLGHLDDATFEEIRAALYDHQVIVVPGQDITTDQQVAFGQRFGELSIHPFSPNQADKPEVIILDNDADNKPALTDQWHSDETFRQCPPFFTILRAKIVPAAGGDTMFASMTTAYDSLSDRMKAHIEGLVAEHDFLPFRQLFGNDPDSKARLRELEDEYPRPWHPVVREHPVTGQKILYVNPQFVTRIVGLPDDESSALLQYLYERARIPENQLRVKWEPNTLVMWDNTAVHHYAVHDYYPQRRSMERVTIAGERPFGPIDESLLPTGALAGTYGTADTGSSGAAIRQFERN